MGSGKSINEVRDGMCPHESSKNEGACNAPLHCFEAIHLLAEACLFLGR